MTISLSREDQEFLKETVCSIHKAICSYAMKIDKESLYFITLKKFEPVYRVNMRNMSIGIVKKDHTRTHRLFKERYLKQEDHIKDQLSYLYIKLHTKYYRPSQDDTQQ